MVLNFPSAPEVGDEYKENDLIYKWDGEKWISKGGQGGQCNSDEIGEITATATETEVTWSAYTGTYPYFRTSVYVSKSEDFTDQDMALRETFQDETKLNTVLSGLDFSVTYYARVSYTDVAGNTRFSEPVSFTSANIPDFEDFIVTQSFGTINLSAYPQGARINIAYVANGSKGADGGKGWNGSESWNGGGGNGGSGGAFYFFDGLVSDMVGRPINDLANGGPNTTTLSSTGGGRGGTIYQTGDGANGTDGGRHPKTNWGPLSEFNGYSFNDGNGGGKGIAASPPSGGGQGGGGGGGGVLVSGPSAPSSPRAQDGNNGQHGQANGKGGDGFGAGGGGGGGCRENENPGNGGNGAAGIAIIKVFWRNSTLLDASAQFIPADPKEY